MERRRCLREMRVLRLVSACLREGDFGTVMRCLMTWSMSSMTDKSIMSYKAVVTLVYKISGFVPACKFRNPSSSRSRACTASSRVSMVSKSVIGCKIVIRRTRAPIAVLQWFMTPKRVWRECGSVMFFVSSRSWAEKGSRMVLQSLINMSWM